ncbi:MAG: hypothetical protein U0794_00580 [Isosphaeraceae bacterium]
MQTKTKAQPVFYRQSFTERLIFTSKPDAATRKALRDGGWKEPGRVVEERGTQPLKAKELADLLALPPWSSSPKASPRPTERFST